MIAGHLLPRHLASDQAGQLQYGRVGDADRLFARLSLFVRVENLDPDPVPLRRHLVQRSVPEIGKDDEDLDRLCWEDHRRPRAGIGGYGEEKGMLPKVNIMPLRSTRPSDKRNAMIRMYEFQLRRFCIS